MKYLEKISKDGIVVVIRLPFNDGNKDSTSNSCVYKFNIIDGCWIQYGTDLDGAFPNDQLGNNVSMLADQTVIGNITVNTKQLKLMTWTTCSSPLLSIPTTATSVKFCSTATSYLRPLASNLLTATYSPLFYFHSIQLTPLSILSAKG